jgi:hypothetical protein
MTEREKTNGLSPGPETPRRAKRPYHKPAVRCEQVFETRAISCGKVQSTQSTCQHNRKS